ncbi:protein ABIL2 [Manihot esculenta]|uniref:Protein ABIL2 n=3 Tax=Manihot esculenta TaxID=3983 RepID=A0A2C9WBC7_MANES|nr:protein ABIL2 [Manihot esculenta]XP_021604183.1 protein ABIL2 [Manihot esculenta]KAG8659025.1 hypothetical protein MANES_02G006800v8 [Manihot esculenta]KAG8659026.1 hypothetical protein MANES_02G006800v8 [Manihot esculenta]OAY56321.1 hypothetical protein MANES_02G006800v8 [Manihot esculenta]
MDKKTLSSSHSGPQEEASNHDEFFMQQSLLFSDTVKDLKILREQLYSAAEYFENSYSKEDQKQLVVETLKDYAIKALINTIDHLGSVAYKVNSFSEEKINQVSALELRFSCLEQRVRTCQEYINHGGLSQQFLMVETPKYHKRYIFPVEETLDSKSRFHRRSCSPEYNSCQFKNAVQATMKGTSPSTLGEGHPRLQSPQFSSRPGTFTFPNTLINKKPDKRASSPQRFPFIRSGSLLPKRAISLNTNVLQRHPPESWRSVSLSTYPDRDGVNEIEQYSSKSKQLFKALLGMRKSRKDHTLYKYLDDA